MNREVGWAGTETSRCVHIAGGQHPMVPPPLCNVNACCVLGDPGGVGVPGMWSLLAKMNP